MVEVRIGGIVVSVLAFSVVDRRFEPARSCQTKDYNIGICSFSAKLTAVCLLTKTLESGYCVRVERLVYPVTVVFVS
jgi:hypothetical protein